VAVKALVETARSPPGMALPYVSETA